MVAQAGGEPVQGGLQAGVKELRHSNAFR